jgi:hypothetical protein
MKPMALSSSRPTAFATLLLAAAVTGANLAACGGSPHSGGFDSDGGSEDATKPSRDASHDAPNLSFDSPSHGAVTGLTISPGTSNITVTKPAKPPTLSLEAIATYKDGTTGPVSASWTVARPDIAGIGAGTGIVTPTGTTFGAVPVTAKALGKTASATVTVALKEVLAAGTVPVPSSARSALDGATTPDPAVTTFAYPYDETYFPMGLLPPEQQWNGGAMGDFYSIHYTGPSFDLTVYTAADPPSRFTLDTADWNVLTSSVPGSDVTIELRRVSGSMAYKSTSQTWHIADANLGGTIYYWSISEGTIYSIDLTTGTRSPVFASGSNTVMGSPAPVGDGGAPAYPPWESNGTAGTDTRCVACHSVSKDGSTLSTIFSRAGSTGPLGFVDIASASITDIANYQLSGTYDALVPDGSQAVLNYGTKTMQLFDKATAAPLASALDGQANLCDPTFSPDGTKFALAAACDPGFGYPVEFRTSNLVVYSYANVAPYFTAPQTIITSTGIGDAIAFPSFSPDSSFIFLQRGSYSRAKYSSSTDTYDHGIDDLYVVPAAAGATPIALANANNPGGVLPADSQHLNYAPTVNPIASGGYVWVVFTSPRDYGNEMVSPQGAPPMDATYSNHKQLWVTAVDANIKTADPSHAPFWLPGQDPTTPNMFGYWALSPCKPTMGDGGPSSCSAGFDCCSGFCRDSGKGPVCVNNPGGCHQTGEKCASTSDCCGASSGVGCIGGICQDTMPR